MPTLVPVDHDPFAEPAAPASAPTPASTPAPTAAAPASSGGYQLVPVDHDPFAAAAPAIPTMAVARTMPAPVAKSPRPDNSGDALTQPHQQQGDFYAAAENVPKQYEPALQAASAKYGVPLSVLHWVGYHESAWNPGAVGIQTSDGTAKGMFQFKDSTAKQFGIDPMQPLQAIDGAARYLRQLADKNGGDWTKAVAAYGTFSTGLGPRRDEMAKAGFQRFLGNTGTLRPNADTTAKYADWDTDAPDTSQADSAVPFREEPGKTRGNLLPIERDDKTGAYSLAVPDIIRAPIRGAVEGGQEALGIRPVNDPQARGDVSAALGFGATPAAKLFATGATKALGTAGTMLGTARDAAAMTAADEMADRPPLPFEKTPQGRGVRLLNQRVNEDIAGGEAKVEPVPPYARPPGDPNAPPMTPAENYVANLARMRASGKPATILDVGGASTKGLFGSRVRDPSTEASAARQFYRQRDTGITDPNTGTIDRSTGAGGRSEADVRQHLTDAPSAYHTADALIGERSEGGNPLYVKSFRGGSIAPLRDQFHDAWVEAGKAEKQAASDVEAAKSSLNAKLAKQTGTRGNVYSTSAANQGVREAQIAVHEAEAAHAEALRIKQQVRSMRDLAQHDIDNNTPGAVWNPRIQRFLDQPEIKSGLRFGFAQERLDAATENRPFNPTEYALTPDGDVIRVPNMRTLNVAKKGLDVMIAAERGKVTPGKLTEYGTTLANFRRELLAELDKVNPDYKAAREFWAGKSASRDALNFGQHFFNLNPEEIAVEFSNMSKGEQDFARLGVADVLLERIGKTNLTADEAKAFIKSHWNEDQLQPFFKTQEQFVRYLKSVEDERLMKEVPSRTMGGSPSIERVQQNAANDLASGVLHAGHAAGHFFSGNIPGTAASVLRAIRHLAPDHRQAVSDAILRQMRDTQSLPRVVNGQVDFGPAP